MMNSIARANGQFRGRKVASFLGLREIEGGEVGGHHHKSRIAQCRWRWGQLTVE